MPAPPYALEVLDDAILIVRADGSQVFRLAAHDRDFAKEILRNLNEGRRA